MQNKTVILIPYRDRLNHLDYFLNNCVSSFLDVYGENIEIAILEQVDDLPFNRGLLLNIGAIIYKESAIPNLTLPSDLYLITQDVDLIPTKECIEKFYFPELEHGSVRGIYTSSANTLGGVVKISASNFLLVNGFPNQYWGHGNEDKSFQNRVEDKDLHISKNIKNDKKTKYFEVLPHPPSAKTVKYQIEESPDFKCLNFHGNLMEYEIYKFLNEEGKRAWEWKMGSLRTIGDVKFSKNENAYRQRPSAQVSFYNIDLQLCESNYFLGGRGQIIPSLNDFNLGPLDADFSLLPR